MHCTRGVACSPCVHLSVGFTGCLRVSHSRLVSEIYSTEVHAHFCMERNEEVRKAHEYLRALLMFTLPACLNACRVWCSQFTIHRSQLPRRQHAAGEEGLFGVHKPSLKSKLGSNTLLCCVPNKELCKSRTQGHFLRKKRANGIFVRPVREHSNPVIVGARDRVQGQITSSDTRNRLSLRNFSMFGI